MYFPEEIDPENANYVNTQNGGQNKIINYCNPVCRALVKRYTCEIDYLRSLISDLQNDKNLLQADKANLENDKKQLIELFVGRANLIEELKSELSDSKP